MVRRTPLLPPRAQRVQTDTSLAIVNVVLLLLLFFLASGSLISAQDTDIDLPTTQELLPEQLPSPLLEVRLDGSLLLDGEPVALSQLDDMLEGAQTLYVLMERTAPALDLLELLAQAPFGTLNVTLVTIHEQADT
ncbi:biopolymer transporter ExbD [Tritonibacter mobilis]|uniref:biopolymer transporter ExbD n=1 Tax=Tritonibacter mobilis TaxID=379347 RepID=UPI0039A499D4